MSYKFENLEVWQLAVEYTDLIYDIADQLPHREEYNLKSQITRAATSIALNIAEGSTSQTDPEQARFLGFAIRSLIETVACQHLIYKRGYLGETVTHCAKPIALARNFSPNSKSSGTHYLAKLLFVKRMSTITPQ